jgi:hypothetical protein
MSGNERHHPESRPESSVPSYDLHQPRSFRIAISSIGLGSFYTGHQAAECTRDCVKMGGKYVLYDAATKTTYQLDDQRTSERFAGQRVNVKGDYDAVRKAIHIESIQPIS